MKMIVIGGTGLIGSKLVEKLRGHGHDATAASPDRGVDTLIGRTSHVLRREGQSVPRGRRFDHSRERKGTP